MTSVFILEVKTRINGWQPWMRNHFKTRTEAEKELESHGNYTDIFRIREYKRIDEQYDKLEDLKEALAQSERLIL